MADYTQKNVMINTEDPRHGPIGPLRVIEVMKMIEDEIDRGNIAINTLAQRLEPYLTESNPEPSSQAMNDPHDHNLVATQLNVLGHHLSLLIKRIQDLTDRIQ